MTTHRPPARWFLGMLASLLLALVAWPQDRSQATERDGEGRKTPLHISTQRGRLSVDLRDADAREVLTQIGREAGISITGDLPAEKRLTVHFADADLEWGLRRLLGLMSVSYVIVSDWRADAEDVVKELRLLGATDVGRRVRVTDARPSGAMAEDISTVSPPLAGLASEADRRFQEALQTGRSGAGPPEEPAATDRLREAGELARRAFASAASEADRRFREAVEGVTAESVQAAPSHQPR